METFKNDMEIPGEKDLEREKPVELKVLFSKEYEIERVKYTLDKLEWFKKNEYRVNLPISIRESTENDKIPNEKEISDAISKEFDEKEYTEQSEYFRKDWDKIEKDFLKNLKTLGTPVSDEYKIHLTKYGVGGIYGYPNNIVVNYDYGKKSVCEIVAHEIVHLSLHGWIEKYNIEHWTKERLVDLILNKFFPNNTRLQRDPENSEKIQEIFDEHFPNIEKVLSNP